MENMLGFMNSGFYTAMQYLSILLNFVLIAALQSLFAGLVLQSMEQKNKQDFEMQLLAAHRAYQGLLKEEKEQDQ